MQGHKILHITFYYVFCLLTEYRQENTPPSFCPNGKGLCLQYIGTENVKNPSFFMKEFVFNQNNHNMIVKKYLLPFFLATMLLVSSCAGGGDERHVEIQTPYGTLALIPLTENSVRVQLTQPDTTHVLEELIYTETLPVPSFEVEQTDRSLTLSMKSIRVEYDKSTDVLVFKDADGDVLLAEKAGGRLMEKSSIQGEPTYVVEQKFLSPSDEYLYGMGQFQDGYLNIRGLSRRLTQVNTQISIPFLLSNKGYGLLWNNYGLTDFNPADRHVTLQRMDGDMKVEAVNVTSSLGNTKEVRNIHMFTAEFDVEQDGDYSLLLDVGQRMARKYQIKVDGKQLVSLNNLWLPPTTSLITKLAKGRHTIVVEGEERDNPTLYWKKVTDETVFRSPVAQALDYTVFAGDADDVIGAYRSLSGQAPLVPEWALGYIHCRERYKTQDELLENATEFRNKQLPIDMIVQDWQYWGKYGWNAMRFDEENYPDPTKMVNQLHDMNMKLMVSVWSKVDLKSEVGKQLTAKGYYIPKSSWVDFFNPDAAAFYWENYSKGLLVHGIDAWWQDATEPENDDLQGRRIFKESMPGEVYRNAYSMFVNRTIYDGLRKEAPDKRVMILTRSGFSGLQRYAATTWSGDVGYNWETLRRQIAGGLGQMASGLPWWTYDAGGFFRPDNQYKDKAYHEQFIRWLQTSTFLPLMRVHGYRSNTEPWHYGSEVERIFTKYVNLRYQLVPYLYSLAASVTFDGYTMMRPLVMDFADDELALAQNYEYMLGPSFLVSPVVEPSVKTWKTYLPEVEGGWIDFWTGESYEGGRTIETEVNMEIIPVFVKAGSILPLSEGGQYVADAVRKPLQIKVYAGADARFELYEDEGDNYNYEKGAYTIIPFTWDEETSVLTIGERKGQFEGMQSTRTFLVTLAGDSRQVEYDGKEIQVKF